MLGMENHENWQITYDELVEWAGFVGLPMQEKGFNNYWHNEYDKEFGVNVDGEETINAWDYCYYLRDEQFHKQQAKASIADIVGIMFDTVDANDDGVVTYFDAVDYVKFYLDTLA